MTSVFGANAVAGAVPMVDVLSSLVQGANASAVHDPAGLLHDMRRGGGGGGDPIAKPIGVMMMMLAVLSAGAHMSHQSQISAALLTGLIFGGLQLDMKSHGKWESLFSSELNITLIELGNVLVLFFAGLSVDVSKVTLYWWPIVVVGSGYGLFATALFAWLGWQSGLCFEPGSVVFFGICCSLSSKQLMVDHLTRVNQYKTLHSSILQGVALFQDGIAIVAMAILDAFQRVKMEIDPIPTRRAEAAVSKEPGIIWHDRYRLGDQIGTSLALTIAVGLVFVILNKFCLERVFRFFTVDGELLFIGTMAYNLGASALCTAIGASPMIGSYFAGLSLSFLPSRHQIEHKISSLRGYGMTTFYFMMGIYVHIDRKFFEQYLGWSIIFTLIVVFVGPIVVWIMGWVAGLQSRTTIYTSLLSNSLGETTLTLQVLAYQAGIFDRSVFLVLVVSTLLSINLCCIGTVFIDRLYDLLRPLVGRYLDQPSSAELKREDEKLKDIQGHIVVLGFNETGQDIAEYFRELKKEVFVVDLDPSLHAALKFAYKGVRGHRKTRCAPVDIFDGVAVHNTARTPAPATATAPAPEVVAPVTLANNPVPFEPEPGPSVAEKLDDDDVEKLVADLSGDSVPPVPEPAPEAGAEAGDVPLPGAAAEEEGVTVAGAGFGVSMALEDCGQGGVDFSSREPPSYTVAGGAMGSGADGESEIADEFEDGTALEGGFQIDGYLFGSCTNIFSILADPELEQTWNRVNLKKAALVVTCLVQRDSKRVCKYMEQTTVPVMSVCSTNKEAEELYEAGCTYALQQEFVAAKEIFSLFCAEKVQVEKMRAEKPDEHEQHWYNFKDRSYDHRDELDEQDHDAVLKMISKFI